MQPFTFIFRGEFRDFEDHFAHIGTPRSFSTGEVVPTVVGGSPVAYFFKSGGGGYFRTTNEFGTDEMFFVLSDYEIYPLTSICPGFALGNNAHLIMGSGMDAYVFPVHFLQTYFSENAAFARAVLNHFVHVTNNFLMRSSLNTYQDAQIKVCIYLYAWISQSRKGNHRFIYVSQDEMAKWCAISRVHLTRTLKKLQDAGLIRTGRKCLEIIDAEKLIDYCRDLGAIL